MVIHFTQAAGREIGTGTVLDRIIISSSPARPSANPCPRCGDNSRDKVVILSCIDCFLYGGELRLFVYDVSVAVLLTTRGGTCTVATSDPPEDVIHRANFLLQNGFGDYNLFKNNCENFAIYCKMGLLVINTISVGRSGQAASWFAAVSTVVSSPLRGLAARFSGLTVLDYGLYFVDRYVSDIGVRPDVVRVPVESLVPG